MSDTAASPSMIELQSATTNEDGGGGAFPNASVSCWPDNLPAVRPDATPLHGGHLPASHSTAQLLEASSPDPGTPTVTEVQQSVLLEQAESTGTQTSPQTRVYSRWSLPNWMKAPHFDYRRILEDYFHGFHVYHPSWLPRGSSVAAVANICASTWGIGSLTMPYAAAHCGVGWFVVGVVFVFAASLVTQYLASTLVDLTQMHSYEMIARSVFKSRRYEVMVEVLLVVNCFGGAIAFNVILGDVVTSIVSAFVVSPTLPLPAIRALSMLVGFLFLMMPLSLMRTVGALQYVSVLGVAAVLLLSLYVILQGIAAADSTTLKPVAAPSFLSFSSGTSLLLSGFNNQFNTIEIYSELNGRTPRQFCGLVAVATSIVGVVYILMGISGLAQYGPSVAGNILSSLNVANSPFALVAMIGVLAKVVFSFPLLMFPTREALLHLFGVESVRLATNRQFYATTLLASSTAFLIGVFVPTIVTLLGLVGSVCVSMFAFVLPAVLIWNTPAFWAELAAAAEKRVATCVVVFALVWGSFIGVSGTIAAVVGFVKGS